VEPVRNRKSIGEEDQRTDGRTDGRTEDARRAAAYVGAAQATRTCHALHVSACSVLSHDAHVNRSTNMPNAHLYRTPCMEAEIYRTVNPSCFVLAERAGCCFKSCT
jgi:hypothetical protein